MKLVINTDGGARGNPGPAGIGVVIATVSGEVVKKFGRYLGDSKTNNEAEYEAIIAAMETAKELGGTHLEFKLDSELIERQLNHVYKVKEPRLQELFLRAKNLQIQFSHVSFSHIPREKNTLADKLVNQAIDNKGN